MIQKSITIIRLCLVIKGASKSLYYRSLPLLPIPMYSIFSKPRTILNPVFLNTKHSMMSRALYWQGETSIPIRKQSCSVHLRLHGTLKNHGGNISHVHNDDINTCVRNQQDYTLGLRVGGGRERVREGVRMWKRDGEEERVWMDMYLCVWLRFLVSDDCQCTIYASL